MEKPKHYLVVSCAFGQFTVHKPNGRQEAIYDIEVAKQLMLQVKEKNPSSGVFLMESIAEAESKTEFFIKELNSRLKQVLISITCDISG